MFVMIGAANNSQQLAMNIHCQRNLKEMFQATQAWSADNANKLLPINYQDASGYRYWYWKILPYLSDKKAIYCPDNPLVIKNNLLSPQRLSPLLPGDKAETINCHISYGYNQIMGVSNLKFSNLKDPGYLIFLGDAFRPYLRPYIPDWLQSYAPVHSKFAQYVTFDGHVEIHSAETLGLVKGNNDWHTDEKRWNNR
jgi:hypothetical protein